MGTQEEGQDPTGTLEAPSAKRMKTQFRCSKCGFITDDSTQFQQHIPQHKTDENTPQCLHCGLCFTSLLSLNRHLFIVHKIKHPEEEEAAEVREKEQDNQPVRLAETDMVDDPLPGLNEIEFPKTEEVANLQCDKNSDCNLKLTSSLTQTVSLR